MSDAELNELMTRAAEGDREAEEIIEDWIASALKGESAWLENPDCCCRKALMRWRESG